MATLKNEKGLTLIEVLISIVILSIILLSIMKFFPQMGFINNENQEKIEANNIAKDYLIQWQNRDDVKAYLKNPLSTPITEYKKVDSNFYYFETTSGKYKINIKIKVNTDLKSTPIKTRLIQVEVLNKRGNIIAKTYGYILLT